MSLRVLLADESDTIKKVFQLALQDFNAEVKGVHSGLDVIDVTLSFNPDIIFADVLLQKKNGYDICLELKQHPKLALVPVVLMWSSFMELDQGQFKRSMANDQLEKPFDADFLRDLVKKYVPVVAANPMASFLNFPKSISADLKEDVKQKAALQENSQLEDASEFNQTAVSGALGAKTGTAAVTVTGRVTQPPDKNTMPPSFDLPPLSFSPQTAPPATSARPTDLGTAQKKSLFEDLKIQSAAIDANEQRSTKTSPTFSSTPSESWQSTDLSKFKLDSDKNDNLDKFESLNLSKPTENKPYVPPLPSFGKDVDSFSQIAVSAALDELVDEDNDGDTQVTSPIDESEELSVGSLVVRVDEEDIAAANAMETANSFTLAGFTTELSKAATSVTSAQSATKASFRPLSSSKESGLNLDAEEIEAIVRAHTEEFIKTEIKQTLFEMMEKIVREELSKVLEEEVSLKQELSRDEQ